MSSSGPRRVVFPDCRHEVWGLTVGSWGWSGKDRGHLCGKRAIASDARWTSSRPTFWPSSGPSSRGGDGETTEALLGLARALVPYPDNEMWAVAVEGWAAARASRHA